MRRLILAASGVALLAAAVLLAWLAFTQFDGGTSAHQFAAQTREGQLRDARTSIFLGLGASFALLGAMACGQLAQRGRAAATAEPATAGPAAGGTGDDVPQP